MTMKLKVDAVLIRDASINVGGGFNHRQVQVLHSYEMAVAIYNDPKTSKAIRAEVLIDIRDLESELYRMGRKK